MLLMEALDPTFLERDTLLEYKEAESSRSRDPKPKPKVAAVQANQAREEPKRESITATTAKSESGSSKKTCLIYKEDRNELLFVPFCSKALKLGALVDTGADISIISPECLAEVKVVRERRIELDVQVASSSTIKVHKEVELEVYHRRYISQALVHCITFSLIWNYSLVGTFGEDLTRLVSVRRLGG